MLKLGSQQRVKRAHNKVRSGCTTCKRRRVKCDEERPVCGGCDRGHRQCEYVELKSWIFEPSNPGEGIFIPPKVQCGPSPIHLPITKESLDFRFFLEHSVPLLCSISDDWQSQLFCSVPSLYADPSGHALTPYRTAAFGRFWSDLVPKIAYQEPVIYKLLCMYASRHRAAVSSAVSNDPTSTLVYYGRAIKKLSSLTSKVSPDITITGAMILFAFDRLVSSIDRTSNDGFGHVVASLNLMMQYPSDIVRDFLIPVGEHFSTIVSMFQQHCNAFQKESVASFEDDVVLPISFENCDQAACSFFSIIGSKYECACMEGAPWTSDCAAYKRQQKLLNHWKTLMQQYYQSLRNKADFHETKTAFTILVEANLILAAAGLSVDESYGNSIEDLSSVKSDARSF